MDNYPGCTLHQIGPYIGKMRPSLARRLLMSYSKKGDWIWDPFCGSGTVALESRLLYRNVIASDINPYACALTRAKLHVPKSEKICIDQLAEAAKSLKKLNEKRYFEIPKWVKLFFHKHTLTETIALVKEFTIKRQYFNMGCLLGILHHQRPGFLSYPASHLVPYLRNRLYPREKYPEAYEYRDPIPRIEAKIKRMFKNPPPTLTTKFNVFKKSASKKYLYDESVNAIITSPPYMDVLDYTRDNRLRLFFLDTHDYRLIKNVEIGKINRFEKDMLITLRIMSQVLKPGGSCVLVLGDVTRPGQNHNVPKMISNLVKDNIKKFDLVNKWVENIPDSRRSRRNGRATKKEFILVFRREK